MSAPARYRKVMIPDVLDGCTYRAMHIESGEILECDDLAGLFKRIAASWIDTPNVRVLPVDIGRVNGWVLTDSWRIQRMVRRTS